MSNSTRSSSPSTGYDERYVVPLEASRRGAHRARVSPVVAVLPVVAVIGIVIGAVVLVYVLFGNRGGGTGTAAQVTTSPAATTAVSPSPTASAAASDTAAPTTSAAVAGVVDKTIAVSVFNGTGTSGLGRRAGDKLTTAGWSVGQPATWTGAAVTETMIYYGVDTQRASAQAIAKALGHGMLKLSPAKAGAGITVVIGPDYPGATGTAPRARASSTRAGTTTSTRAAGAGGSSTSKAATPSPTGTAAT